MHRLPSHRRGFAPYAFAAPAVLIMLLGLVSPMFEAVRLLLDEVQPGAAPTPQALRGLAILAEALADASTRAAMLVTLQFAAVVVIIEMALGVSLALLMDKPIRGMGAFRALFMLPMMIAPVCVGLIWRYLLDTQVGPVNTLLGVAGWRPAWLAEPDLAFAALCVADIWQFTPFVFVLALAGLQGIDPSLAEAARIDGASPLQIIRFIKLPLLAPVLMIIVVVRLIDALRGPELVSALTGGGPRLATELFSLHVYKTAFVTRHMAHAAALSLALLAVTTLLGALLLVWIRPMRASLARRKR